MQNLLFPAGQINIEDMYIRVYAEKLSPFRRIHHFYFKKEKIQEAIDGHRAFLAVQAARPRLVLDCDHASFFLKIAPIPTGKPGKPQRSLPGIS